MRRRGFVAAVVAVTGLLASAAPVWAHGDHDARPLARDLQAGPHRVSLWQVYPDVGTAMTPHLIVMVEGAAAPTGVSATMGGAPLTVRPSTTTANGWETSEGLVEGQVVAVTIVAGDQAWSLEPVVVPPPPTSLLPMQELIYASIFLTFATACWMAGRTARAWRRPVLRPT